MSKAQRRSPRFAIRQLTHLSYGREAYLDAEGVNISKTGLLCRTEEPIAVKCKVFLTLDILPVASDPFGCEGRVVRCERQPDNYFEVAVTFTNVEQRAKTALSELF